MINPRGKIFFISGPSGVGKGSLITALKKKHSQWKFPPSCTTRRPRPGEKNGDSYVFIDQDMFKKHIDNNDFLEYACVHQDNWYGTLKNPLIEPMEKGYTVIKEFDVQGFMQVQEKLDPEIFRGIFLLPEHGEEELIHRIQSRAPMPEEEIKRRMVSVKKEISLSHIYDYKVISYEKDIPRLVQEVEQIILTS